MQMETSTSQKPEPISFDASRRMEPSRRLPATELVALPVRATPQHSPPFVFRLAWRWIRPATFTLRIGAPVACCSLHPLERSQESPATDSAAIPATVDRLYNRRLNPAEALPSIRGIVYFTQSHRIRQVLSSGVVTTLAGSTEPNFAGDAGSRTGARFRSPQGLAVDKDSYVNVYIADTGNWRVRR